jgi:hypothetical protein
MEDGNGDAWSTTVAAARVRGPFSVQKLLRIKTTGRQATLIGLRRNREKVGPSLDLSIGRVARDQMALSSLGIPKTLARLLTAIGSQKVSSELIWLCAFVTT